MSLSWDPHLIAVPTCAKPLWTNLRGYDHPLCMCGGMLQDLAPTASLKFEHWSFHSLSCSMDLTFSLAKTVTNSGLSIAFSKGFCVISRERAKLVQCFFLQVTGIFVNCISSNWFFWVGHTLFIVWHPNCFTKKNLGSSKDLFFSRGHPAADCDLYFVYLDHCSLAQYSWAIDPMFQ